MPRTSIFGKTLVNTALLLVLYCCFEKRSFQAVLPFPHGSSVSSAPGTTPQRNPSFRYGTDVETLPQWCTAAWCPCCPLCGPASRGYCKVLFLVKVKFWLPRVAFRLGLPKKLVLKVADQTMHRHTVYPMYKSKFWQVEKIGF